MTSRVAVMIAVLMRLVTSLMRVGHVPMVVRLTRIPVILVVRVVMFMLVLMIMFVLMVTIVVGHITVISMMMGLTLIFLMSSMSKLRGNHRSSVHRNSQMNQVEAYQYDCNKERLHIYKEKGAYEAIDKI